MTKVILSVVLFALFSLELFAQDYRAMARPQDSREWGYIDETGKMVIKPQFRDCLSFTSEGFAIIKEKRQHQFIDANGKQLKVPYKKFYLKEFTWGFTASIMNFDDGLAPIREKKLLGFLNTEGKLAIEMKYENVSGFRDGNAFAILKGNFFILDTEGKAYPINTDIVEIKRPSEGMAAYRAKDKTWGFVDVKGKVAIKAKFNRVGKFSHGLAWARDENDKIGYLNKDGKWAIKPQYDAAKHFDPVSGIAKVKSADGSIYIKKRWFSTKIEY